MEFLLGFLGAVLAVALFGLGMYAEWKLRERACERQQKVTAEQLTEEQKRMLREEQEAWKALHNYSVEDAYNIYPAPKTSDKE